MQIIVGTSKGVNLRNLSWHGFLDNVDPSYLTFLFVTLVSYGKQLQGKLLIVSRYQDEVDWHISIHADETYNELVESNTINMSNIKAWQTILKFYECEHNIAGVFLILSQIEGLLRHIYGELNNEDVIARLNKYYIIMDSICYGYVLKEDITPLAIGKITKVQELEIRRSSRKNRMLEILPRSLVMLLYDLFYCIDGPRIRDKLSHGEIIIDNNNSRQIFRTLLKFSLLVIKFYDQKNSLENFKYQSTFMSCFKFVHSFNLINLKLSNIFNTLKIGENLAFKVKRTKIIKVDCEEVKIIFPSLIEPQVIKLLQNILDNFDKALDNFQSSASELFELFMLRKLSTKRRSVVENLIKDLSNFSRGFELILNQLYKTFFTIQNLDHDFFDDKWSSNLIKLLKQTLKLCENLVRYFSIQNRNFFVAHQKICDFLHFIDMNDNLLSFENK